MPEQRWTEQVSRATFVFFVTQSQTHTLTLCFVSSPFPFSIHSPVCLHLSLLFKLPLFPFIAVKASPFSRVLSLTQTHPFSLCECSHVPSHYPRFFTPAFPFLIGIIGYTLFSCIFLFVFKFSVFRSKRGRFQFFDKQLWIWHRVLVARLRRTKFSMLLRSMFPSLFLLLASRILMLDFESLFCFSKMRFMC